MLKISAFYLDKEKSFIPKKIEVHHVPWIALISANFPHPRLWLELPDLDQIWIKVTTLKIFYVTWLGWTGNQIRDWLDWASNWQFLFFWPTFSTKLWSDKINGLFASKLISEKLGSKLMKRIFLLAKGQEISDTIRSKINDY